MATKESRGKKAAETRAANKEADKKKKQVRAIILFAIGLFLAFLVLIPGESLWLIMHDFIFGIFGITSYLIPIAVIYISILLAKDKNKRFISVRTVEIISIAILASLIITIIFVPITDGFFEYISKSYLTGINLVGGGVFSAVLSYPLMAALGKTGAIVVVSIILFVLILLVSGVSLIAFLTNASKPAKKVGEVVSDAVRDNAEKRAQKQTEKKFDIDVKLPESTDPIPDIFEEPEDIASGVIAVEDIAPDTVIADIDDIIKAKAAAAQQRFEEPVDLLDEPPKIEVKTQENKTDFKDYILPPTTILSYDKGGKNSDATNELRQNAVLLEDTLKSFGVLARIIDISRGPTVTRYELQPSAGVKISKITSLADDIALSLAATGVRIEAPIPGKSAIGIEVPNKVNSAVRIREVLETHKFRNAKSRLSTALGKDIGGDVIIADIAKMPHLLIAGATGSGKSVCINSIIISLLYKATPAELEFIMIDPKVVELGIYNGIPHLSKTPVVTDPRKASGALMSAVKEMENRYKMFAEVGARDFAAYNEIAATRDDLRVIPHIVIIIDELADLMMVAPSEVEDSICRLAQMARAAGMHLIVATQRPSVNVITGTIKANIPSRIAFSVSSQIDSRTIIDGAGAEKLIGRGDMLFFPVGNTKPIRVQGCFVTDKEVADVVEFVKKSGEPVYDDEFIKNMETFADNPKAATTAGGNNAASGESSIINSAIELVIDAGQASTSYLQRRLKLGYARAARIMDEMEDMGIIGPADGSKPRVILITKQQWIERNLNSGE